MSIDHKYLVESADDRDGGRHTIVLSMIDNKTGAKATVKICVFEHSFKDAANRIAAWLNSQESTHAH